jgi:gluconolactonase
MSLATRAPAFESYSPAFATVLGDAPRLDRIVETDAHEGPVYMRDEDALYFTSLPRAGAVAIRRLDVGSGEVRTVREAANGANGMTLAPDGRLVVCEQGSLAQPARITLVDRASGVAETLCEGWNGAPLNSPNDVVVSGDGSVWFTDPAYGHLQGFRPAPRAGDHVYRLDPSSGEVEVASSSFDKPNGIAFAPGERTLYVTDSGANQEEGSFYEDRPHQIVAFDVVGGRRLERERVLAVIAPGFPDGIKCDADGRVYASSFAGVDVFDAAGEPLGRIALPGAVNFTWGGPRSDVLFITTDTAVWAAALDAKGARP